MCVIVKGMRLPDCCAECELSESDEDGIFCNVLEVFMRFDELPKGRRYDCPIFDENTETLQSIVINDRYGNVAEYAKVIRCKDCKYWLPHHQFGFDSDNEEYHDYCEKHLPEDDYYAFEKNANDYCSWAKLKEKR